jgi:Domain of unknown function (DUF6265)
MKIMKVLFPLIAALASMMSAAADMDIRALAPEATPATATLNDFKGLVGQWAGPAGVAGFSAPSGGQMVGHLLLLNADKTPRVEEIWILRPEGASVLVRQKHYTPDLKDREDKDQWAERRLVAIDPGHVYLNNLTWVTKGSSLDLMVQIPGQNGAAPTRLSFSFERAK